MMSLIPKSRFQTDVVIFQPGIILSFLSIFADINRFKEQKVKGTDGIGSKGKKQKNW